MQYDIHCAAEEFQRGVQQRYDVLFLGNVRPAEVGTCAHLFDFLNCALSLLLIAVADKNIRTAVCIVQCAGFAYATASAYHQHIFSGKVQL